MFRHTKIIATVGPSCESREQLAALLQAGAEVFRLNFSHGNRQDKAVVIQRLRDLSRERQRPLAILGDLQGPKIRVGTLRGGELLLTSGQTVVLTTAEVVGEEDVVPVRYPHLSDEATVGARILLDDGLLELEVEAVQAGQVRCRVLVGGLLRDRKGVNLPGGGQAAPAITEQDREDALFCVREGVDYLALSFVRRAADVLELKQLLLDAGAALPVIAKIEKPQAVEDFAAILEAADGIMVARGDLGVECPPETVPILQKRIVKACRAAGKPVVVATQMLDSMVHSPAPTRAEASDVATAIYDGADAVMLSAETAAGDYPIDAVTMMDRIINRVERDEQYRLIMDASRTAPDNTTRDAISAAARQVAQTLNCAAVVTFTSSGSTTLRAARERPEQPIINLTSDIEVARQLALVWGVHSVQTAEVRSFSEMVQKSCRAAQREGFAKVGDRIVITAGVPFGCSGTTNILRVAEIDDGGEVM